MKYNIVHGCIRVMDLEKSLDFYMNALSLKEVSRKDFPEHKFTLVYLSDEAGNFEIEITYNYNPEKPYEIGNGFSHFALTVENLEESHETHKNMGYEVTDLKGLPGSAPQYYFVTDPDGYKVEIIRA
ncbi:VOC family protein [Clostridium grantii]|uniref:Aldoketomutase n=1 Tax=Clostridium grantii DSM 8605 TaxID=1121316 RepID=A0A1M5S2Y7_9CLOT|nr:VOC family protein [Clostridium grantii]SHH32821.1 lactoylglutathione lyase [Clostridium grantii DSM 8605]